MGKLTTIAIKIFVVLGAITVSALFSMAAFPPTNPPLQIVVALMWFLTGVFTARICAIE